MSGSSRQLQRRRPRRPLAEVADRQLLGGLDDPATMVELVRRHQQRLFQMAFNMLRDRRDAEEAVQDTFVQAYNHADGFRGDAQVSTWLHSICYRQVLARTRRKRHLTVALDAAAEPAVASGDAALAVAIRRALEELPAANREAFILVDVLGHSRAEAAAIVDVEPNTMRARVARARQLLAELLATGDDGEELT